MLEYYGVSLLNELQDYYLPRLRLAEERGYAVQNNKYFWLYDELRQRVLMLRQTLLFLESLPHFMNDGKDDCQAMQYAVRYTGKLFSEESIDNIPCSAQDIHPFFNDSDPYWRDLQEALENFDNSYDLQNLPMLYVDLCEYVTRAIRLYFHIRERQFKAIDRGKFDALMHLRSPVQNAG